MAGRLRNRMLNVAARTILFRDVNAHFQQARGRLKLAPFPGGFLDSLLSPYLYLQPTIPAFEYPRSDLPAQVHFVGPLLPDPPAGFAPPAWWNDLQDARRPVIHVTQGTSATDASQLIAPTLQALAGENVLVVATTGGRSVESLGLDSIPANARVEKFIPYAHLMPHISAMITNGGYGGVQSALMHGVPLIVAGTTEDKPEIANRVAWSGVGINLKTKTPAPARVREAVHRLMSDPRYRLKARELRAEMARYHAPAEAAALLEELATTKQPVTRHASVTRAGVPRLSVPGASG
jgi:MGT family glycosyltransferase